MRRTKTCLSWSAGRVPVLNFPADAADAIRAGWLGGFGVVKRSCGKNQVSEAKPPTTGGRLTSRQIKTTYKLGVGLGCLQNPYIQKLKNPYTK